MADVDRNIEELKSKVKEFCEARDWDQYHSAKDLSIGLSTEAAELLEIFRFRSEAEEREVLQKSRVEISEELADCLFFILRFAQKYNFDLDESFQNKMKKNAERYTVEKAKGSNEKL